jgi:hypothetical protein
MMVIALFRRFLIHAGSVRTGTLAPVVAG